MRAIREVTSLHCLHLLQLQFPGRAQNYVYSVCLWVPNTVLIKGCIGDFSVNGGKISQLEMCVTLLRKRWWLCVPTLACVVVLPECDVQQQTNKMPKDRVK